MLTNPGYQFSMWNDSNYEIEVLWKVTIKSVLCLFFFLFASLIKREDDFFFIVMVLNGIIQDSLLLCKNALFMMVSFIAHGLCGHSE